MKRTQERIEGIRARLAASISGPWYRPEPMNHLVRLAPGVEISLRDYRYASDGFEMKATADLIANAPDDLAWACDEIERLGAENERLRHPLITVEGIDCKENL